MLSTPALLLAAALAVAPAGGPATAPEARLEATVRRVLAAPHGSELRSDPALRDAARDLALLLSRGLEADAQEHVRPALARHGLVDPYPYVFRGAAPRAQLVALEARLAVGLGGLPSFERGLYTHVAAGVVERTERRFLLFPAPRVHVVVLVTQRAVSFAPLPWEVEPQDRLCFEGEVHAPFRAPLVMVTYPDGSTAELDNLALAPDEFRTWVAFDRGPGEYQLEVLGRYDLGPRVLALTSLLARSPGTTTAHERLLAAARAGSLAAAPAVKRPAPDASPEAAEARLLHLLERDRRRAGLAPLGNDPVLAAMARAHSADMRDHDFFAHVSPRTGRLVERATQAGLRYRRLAENIAVHRSVEEAEAELLRSPGHRCNILSSEFTHVGVGVALGTDVQGEPRVFVTQNFMIPVP